MIFLTLDQETPTLLNSSTTFFQRSLSVAKSWEACFPPYKLFNQYGAFSSLRGQGSGHLVPLSSLSVGNLCMHACRGTYLQYNVSVMIYDFCYRINTSLLFLIFLYLFSVVTLYHLSHLYLFLCFLLVNIVKWQRHVHYIWRNCVVEFLPTVICNLWKERHTMATP